MQNISFDTLSLIQVLNKMAMVFEDGEVFPTHHFYNDTENMWYPEGLYEFWRDYKVMYDPDSENRILFALSADDKQYLDEVFPELQFFYDADDNMIRVFAMDETGEVPWEASVGPGFWV